MLLIDTSVSGGRKNLATRVRGGDGGGKSHREDRYSFLDGLSTLVLVTKGLALGYSPRPALKRIGSSTTVGDNRPDGTGFKSPMSLPPWMKRDD